MTTLTRERASELLNYDPATGIFIWKYAKGRRGGLVGGEKAGWLDSDTGYWKISIDGKNCLAHRVAWLLMTGEWPKEQIDHRDLNRANNSWGNLRKGSQSLNNGNLAKPATNTSGYKGVSWSKQARAWWAQITFEGVHYNLGMHADPKAAAVAYDAKAKELFGDFARTNFGEARA